MADIAVIGAGYVGLTTGACLASLGHNVTIADNDEKKIQDLEEGMIPIFESGLAELVSTAVSNNNLHFVIGARNASSTAQFHFLCLPTPPMSDGTTDMQYFHAALEEIKEIIPPESIIVNKSTLPVGSASNIKNLLSRKDVEIVSNPEFLSEGNAVQDFLNPARIVVGAESDEAATKVAALYSRIDAPIVQTDAASAELTKHTANAFLAMKLTFVNEIAALCELVGANITDVTKGIGLDPRIGSSYLQPGPGWGGSCFPKDSSSLIQTAKRVGFDFELLEKAIDRNQVHLERTAKKIMDELPDENAPDEGKVAILGLTFKAGTDDLRSSPSLAVIGHLLAQNIQVAGYDPMVFEAVEELEELDISSDAYRAATGADVLVILTEWEEFAGLDFKKIRDVMRQPVIVDARNLLRRRDMEDYGFRYTGLGQ